MKVKENFLDLRTKGLGLKVPGGNVSQSLHEGNWAGLKDLPGPLKKRLTEECLSNCSNMPKDKAFRPQGWFQIGP